MNINYKPFLRILDHPRSFSGGMDQIKADPEKEAEMKEYNSPEVLGKKVPGLPHDIWYVSRYVYSRIFYIFYMHIITFIVVYLY